MNLTKNLLQRDFMVLDSKTISKLDLIGGMGSLQKSLDNCKTAFGKRYENQVYQKKIFSTILRLITIFKSYDNIIDKIINFCLLLRFRLLLEWICRPSCNIDLITDRQNAIKELYHNPQLLKTTQDLLRKLPDLRRQIAK